jgi:hypothetical protein
LASFETIGIFQVARPTVAAFCKVSPSSSGYEKNLGVLKNSGMISYPAPGFITLTITGQANAASAARPASLKELHEGWCRVASKPQAEIIRRLVASYPSCITRHYLAQMVGVSEDSSGFEKNLGRLRSYGAIEYPVHGSVRASKNLFPEGLS